MKRHSTLMCLAACILFSLSLLAQELKPGLIVESVAANLEAEKAGLKEGDVLLRWSRGDARGEIDSPFDVSLTEFEQAQRGTVTLEGLRGAEEKVWTLGPGAWGMKVRPNFQGSLLTSYGEAQALIKADKLSEAAERLQAVAGQKDESATRWLHSWLLSQAAETFAKGQQWKEADSAYQQAVQQAAEAAPPTRGLLLRAWAKKYQQRSDWRNAEKCYQRSMTEMQKLGPESSIVAADLEDLGTVSLRHGDLAKAERYHRQALEMRQKLGPATLDVAASFIDLAVVAGRQGDLAKAEQYGRQALKIQQERAPGSLDHAYALNNLGNVADARGDLAEAEDDYRQALDIKRKLAPESLDVAAGLDNLGMVAGQRGNLTKAEEYERQALDIRQKLAPESLDLARSFHNLGNTVEKRGDLAKAEGYYRQALEIRQKLSPASLDVASSFDSLGSVAEQLGDLAKAEQYDHQAFEIKQKLAPESLDVAFTLSNLGSVAKARGDRAKAEEYDRQALEIQQTLAPASLDAASTYQHLADLAKDRQDLATAERHYRQALAIRGKLAPDSAAHAESLASLAQVMWQKGEPDSAAQLYEQALNALENQIGLLGGEEETRSNFRARHEGYYRDYVDLLLAQKRPERALEVLERSRARTMLEMLNAVHIDVHNGVDAALLEQQRSLRADITAKSNRRLRLLADKETEQQAAMVGKEIDDLMTQYKDVEEQIRIGSAGYAALTQPQPLGAGQLHELLDIDTMLLEYSLGEDRSYLFVLTASSINTFALPKRAEIESKARHLYGLLTARNLSIPRESADRRQMRVARADAEYLKQASDLSRILLGPIAAELTRRRLLIVSDGALHYVPFDALPLPSADPSPAPLLVHHEIVNLPSASVLAVLRQERANRQPPEKEVAVLADPVFSDRDERVKHSPRVGEPLSSVETGTKHRSPSPAPDSTSQLTRSLADLSLAEGGHLHLSRLPFSRREAAAILACTPPGMAKQALDFEANRGFVTSRELTRYRIVHFATHGLLDNEHPELSGLVLSLVDEQGRPQDGFIELQDIYNLNLAADLVVLSACDTALGKQVEGEGVIGLTRGFMYAGASTVISSLWKVEDFATAKLMTSFYHFTEQQKMRPAAALRAAQLELWKQKHWAAPYYWAAFTLQGEWK
jgi:CHAT domain-containing protein/tetratricopeptide (TPR) repeat protein